MKKSLVALLLALVMLVTCVPFSLADDTVTLNVWVGGYKQKDSDRVWEAVNEKLADYLPNTKLNIVPISFDEYASKWSKAMAAGEQIDVAWLGWVHDMQNEVQMGSLLKLDDLIAEYGQDMLAEYGQEILDADRIDGDIYFIPNGPVLGGGKYCLVFPKELLEKAGMPNFAQELEDLMMEVFDSYTVENVKKLYDKMEEYLEALKAAGSINMGVNGKIVDSNYGPFGQTYCNQWGYERMFQVNWGDDTFTVESMYVPGSETYNVDAYEWERIHDWYKKGYIREDYASAGWAPFGAGYAFENMAMAGNNQFAYDYVNWTKEEVYEIYKNVYGWNVEIAVCNPVQTKGGRGFSTGVGIPYTSKNPERAMQLINLLHSTKGQELFRMLAYGLEGEHYTVNEDGSVTFANPTAREGADSTYGLSDWSIGSNLNKIGKDQEIVMKQVELGKNAVANPLDGFVFDRTAVDDQFSNCTSFVSNNLFAMVMDDWQARREQRDKDFANCGVEEVMAELQRQITEYVTENNITSWPDRREAAGMK